MKPLIVHFAAMAAAALAGCASPRATGPSRADAETWKTRFGALPTDYKPTEPFSPRELTRLVAHPRENPRRLMWLVNRAGAEKDHRFGYMLSRKDAILDQRRPHETHALALALAGYEYSVTGAPAALDTLLDDLARQPTGSDADAVVALAFIDEWERTPAAIQKHFVRSDGAGSIARAHFWMCREYLFPDSFATHKARAASPRLHRTANGPTPSQPGTRQASL